MSVSYIDGTVIEAPVKIRRKALVRYGHVLLERRDGGTERIDKPLAERTIAEGIVPGAQGRFYLYKALDVKGIHGIRLADGTERHAYLFNNAWVFGIVAVVNLAWVALRILAYGDVPLLGVALLGLGIVGFLLTRSSREAARRQFEADGGSYRTPEPLGAVVAAPGTE